LSLSQDHRDSFTNVPDLVVRKQRLLWIDELVLHQGCPFGRQCELGIRDWRQLPGEL